MDQNRLVEALSDPQAYPHPCGEVEVRHTHISTVFLAGEHAYKVKKPLNLGFLDFTTLEAREHYCREEVRLNRRLAPSVYLGVEPVVVEEGRVRVGGSGEPREWAVHMQRLPDHATLAERLRRGRVAEGEIRELAARIAGFHRRAERGDRVAACGRWEVVARNARENFEQTAEHVGTTVSREVHGRVRQGTEEALASLRSLVEDRAERGVPCDTHGDLHLDHVYLFPERPAPDDVVVVDCIEFSERFRYADPVADMAFLFMDLIFTGHRPLGRRFAQVYFEVSGDREGCRLLPFYAAYRAAVRAKVRGMQVFQSDVPAREREVARESARGHWLLALGQLVEPSRSPGLVCVAGLPGTGKSTLARGLGESAGFTVISSDRVRKELAGLPPDAAATAAFGEGIYSEAWNDRTYEECLRRAEESLWRGERVAVDASFREERRRAPFLDAGARWAVPAVILLCEAPEERVMRRLTDRTGDPSDADREVYRRAARRWDPPGPEASLVWHPVTCVGSPEESLGRALEVLQAEGLR